MDEARAVLARLERIDRLDRTGAPATDVLAELRALLREAEAWARSDPAARAAVGALEQCREALARGCETAQTAGRTLVA